jgi:hypothetical protein
VASPMNLYGIYRKLDKIDLQKLRKFTSKDELEQFIWAEDDKKAVNHIPRRRVVGFEEASR